MTPTPDEIRTARQRAGMTQLEALALVHGHPTRPDSWNCWENGSRVMPAAEWELFLLKTGQAK